MTSTPTIRHLIAVSGGDPSSGIDSDACFIASQKLIKLAEDRMLLGEERPDVVHLFDEAFVLANEVTDGQQKCQLQIPLGAFYLGFSDHIFRETVGKLIIRDALKLAALMGDKQYMRVVAECGYRDIVPEMLGLKSF